MRPRGPRARWLGFLVASLSLLMLAPAAPAAGAGVGDASWTPSRSTTTALPSTFLVLGDAITFTTRMAWSRDQLDGLRRYVGNGLRYTHEVNDRSGRLSATGYWATDLPDPAFDRDDDDEDGRWEEAEITAGSELPEAGSTYTTLIQLSRWHPVQRRVRCDWSWDLRAGQAEVLSQLSREMLGEWQAERYTLAFDRATWDRLAPRPELPVDVQPPDCGPAGDAGSTTDGVVVTFRRPLGWEAFAAVADQEPDGWASFEAIGSRYGSDRVWTCGGPAAGRSGLLACRSMGVVPDGVVAAGGHFSAAQVERIRRDPRVLRVADWRDALPTWVAELAGFDVEPPDLTLDDAYWPEVLGR